jgi:hypothetical protein
MRSTNVTPLTQKGQVSNRSYCDSMLLVSRTKLKNKLLFFFNPFALSSSRFISIFLKTEFQPSVVWQTWFENKSNDRMHTKTGNMTLLQQSWLIFPCSKHATPCKLCTAPNTSDEHAATIFRRVSCKTLRNKAVKSRRLLISVHVFKRSLSSPQVG